MTPARTVASATLLCSLAIFVYACEHSSPPVLPALPDAPSGGALSYRKDVAPVLES